MNLQRARLQKRVGEGNVRCLVCERRCVIAQGRRGFCGAYGNVDGVLVHYGWGRLSAVESRPIEIKPLFHYWPNSTALTFSGWGCNFLCPWCQNYLLSWSRVSTDYPVIPPEKLVKWALEAGDEGLCASFNEPATLYDYLLEVAGQARKQGLYLTIVTNAYFTPQAIERLVQAGFDGWSVDIKGCPRAKKITPQVLPGVNHEYIYRNARIVLDNGGHVEMVYLVVTGFNEECLDWIVDMHLKHLGPDVPLHINRYYPANRWHKPPTRLETLLKAKEKAVREGLEYVYVGNIGDPAQESTFCPRCGKLVIERTGYRVTYWALNRDASGAYRCPRCGYKIPIRGRYIKNKRLTFRQLI